jgi:DNA-binding NarL/FixJ family response regulator
MGNVADEIRGLCHELRQRIAAVLMLAEVAGAQPDLNTATRAAIKSIADQAAEIGELVREVAARDPLVSPSPPVLTRIPVPVPAGQSDTDQDASARTVVRYLTGREREVLRRIVDGESTGEIARGLAIAQSTVRAHVQNVLVKLGARSRVQAAAIVSRVGAVGLLAS